MAYDIGPRITLKGEAEFNKSIQNVNQRLKECGSESKKVASEFEGQEKSVESLTRQNEVLQKQLQLQQEKLKIYRDQLEKLTAKQTEQKKALEEATAKFGENSKEVQAAQKNYDATTNQISKLNVAVNETETYCNKAKKSISDNSAAIQEMGGAYEGVTEKISSAGSKVKEIGKGMSVVSAGIFGVGVASQKAWSEIDEAYDSIAAGTGATGKALESLQGSFDKVYGSFPAESEDVGNAIADINTRFGFTNEKLESCTEEFLKFSQVTGLDVKTSVSLVSRAMGDAGIESENYKEVLDTLTAASQSSGIAVDKLTESVTKYGAPMRALGFDMQESIALFAQWEKAGVNTEIAFSGMKKAISSWSKEGKDARVEFSKTLQKIQEAPDIADATSIAIEAFGSKAGPDLADAIQGGRFSIEEMMQTVSKAGGIVDQSFTDMLDPADQATVAMNNLKLVGADLASSMQGALAPLLTALVGLLQSFANWFKSLPEPVKQVIVVVGGLVAAIGPLLVIIGTVMEKATSISTFITNFGPMITSMGGIVKTVLSGIGAAAQGLFTLIMAHPVIAIITAIIAAVVLLYNKCEWFRNAVNAVLKFLGDLVTEIGRGMVEWFTVTLPNSLSQLGQQFANIGQSIKNSWDTMCRNIRNAWNNLISIFSNLWSKASGWGKDLVDGFISGINSMWNSLKKKVTGIADMISSFLHFSVPEKGPLEDFDESGGDMMDLLIDGIESKRKQLEETIRGVAESMQLNSTILAGGSGTMTVEMPVYLDGRQIQKSVNSISVSRAQADKIARGG